jgi:hypothetical protein
MQCLSGATQTWQALAWENRWFGSGDQGFSQAVDFKGLCRYGRLNPIAAMVKEEKAGQAARPGHARGLIFFFTGPRKVGIVFRPMPSIRLERARNGSPPSGAGVLIRDESSKQRETGQGKAKRDEAKAKQLAKQTTKFQMQQEAVSVVSDTCFWALVLSRLCRKEL